MKVARMTIVFSLLVLAVGATAPVGAKERSIPDDSPLTNIVAGNSAYAESKSMWIIQYDSPTEGKVTRVFEGPAPNHAYSFSSKDGEMGAPSPNDFGDPSHWAGTGVPNHGTISWSGTWTSNDGSQWDTSVTWQGDGSGTWTITSFTTSQIDPAENDPLPPTEDQ